MSAAPQPGASSSDTRKFAEPLTYIQRPSFAAEQREWRYSAGHGFQKDRQGTTSTQDSRGSHASHSSSETHRKRVVKSAKRPTSKTAHKPSSGRRVSTLSLPDFRKNPPTLHWPAPNEAIGAAISATQMCQSPDGEFRRHLGYQGNSNKSTVWSMVAKTSDGRDEILALKVVSCNLAPGSDQFRKDTQHEYDLLAKINHNHIIAVVGSYFDGDPGDWNYGLLLYPLAPHNLDNIVRAVSQHNLAQKDPSTFGRHEKVDDLLDHLACLCQAIIHLHTLDEPIKHRDVKPANILIDAHGTVILADFDIAKKYSDRFAANTDGPTHHTERYANKAVREGAERSFEWDVYSLGCVFLEIATVVMGETVQNLQLHMGGSTSVDIDYHEALQAGDVDSWVAHLKSNALENPERAPLGRFILGDPGELPSPLDAFFSTIIAMMRVTMTNYSTVLENAWLCFSQLASKDCEYCHPKFVLDKDVSLSVVDSSSGHQGLRPGSPVPKVTSLKKISPIPEGETILGASSATSQQSPAGLEAKPLRNYQEDFHAQSSAVMTENGNGTVVATKDDSCTNSPQKRENLRREQKYLTERLHQVNLELGDESQDAGLIPAKRLHQVDSEEGHTQNAGPKVTLTRASTTTNLAEHDTIDVDATSHGQDTRRHTDGAITPSTVSYQTDDEVVLSDQQRPSTGSKTIVNDTEAPTRDAPKANHGQVVTTYSEKTITPGKVRLLHFNRKGGRTLDFLEPDCLAGIKVLVYRGPKVAFETRTIDSTSQLVLNGAFFDFPRTTNTRIRLPHTSNAPGDIIHLRTLLQYRLMFKCIVGALKYIYVPGCFEDEALKICATYR